MCTIYLVVKCVIVWPFSLGLIHSIMLFLSFIHIYSNCTVNVPLSDLQQFWFCDVLTARHELQIACRYIFLCISFFSMSNKYCMGYKITSRNCMHIQYLCSKHTCAPRRDEIKLCADIYQFVRMIRWPRVWFSRGSPV